MSPFGSMLALRCPVAWEVTENVDFEIELMGHQAGGI